MRFKPTAVNLSNLGVGAILTIALPLMYAKDLERLVGGLRLATSTKLNRYTRREA